jgi:vacuolar-type H+-ATPase subunit I/STV1
MVFGSERRQRIREERERTEAQKKHEEERRQEEYEARLNVLKEQASKYLLTTSAEAYVGSIGKKLSDFDQRSIDAVYVGERDLEGTILKCKMMLLEQRVKLAAEIVVEIRPTISVSVYFSYHEYHYQPVYMMGTALIPKKRNFG